MASVLFINERARATSSCVPGAAIAQDFGELHDVRLIRGVAMRDVELRPAAAQIEIIRGHLCANADEDVVPRSRHGRNSGAGGFDVPTGLSPQSAHVASNPTRYNSMPRSARDLPGCVAMLAMLFW